MLDESTDSGKKAFHMYSLIVKEGEAVTKFLCNVPVDDGCAHTIMNCVADTMDQLGIPLYLRTSLSTDGRKMFGVSHGFNSSPSSPHSVSKLKAVWNN
jgi:hypothetical protein